MAESITTAFLARVSAALAQRAVSGSVKKLAKTNLGKELIEHGILSPDTKKKLRNALAIAIKKFLDENPQYKQTGVLRFLEDPGVGNTVAEWLLYAKPIDRVRLTSLLADYLDVPRKAHISSWPNGIQPTEFIDSLVTTFRRELAETADTNIVWLSQQLVGIDQALAAAQKSLDAITSEIPTIFEESASKQSRVEWTAFESDYLDHIASRFARLTVPGIRELQGTKQALSIAYISLNVRQAGRSESISAEDLLARNPLIVVRGPAGSGKTTLLSWITWRCTQSTDTANPWRGGIPIFIPLRSIAAQDEKEPRVSNFVGYSVDQSQWTLPTPSGWINSMLRREKRAIVMIDGVDELPSQKRPAFWLWLAKFIDTYPDNKVIVTSRTLPGTTEEKGIKHSEQWNPPAGFVDTELEAMSSAEIKVFVENWHDSIDQNRIEPQERADLVRARDSLPKKLEDPANRRIRELCGTPLLCAMVCVLHWRDEGYLPTQRVDLYSKCCDMLIEARDLKRGILPPQGPLGALTKDDKEMMLQQLAYDMMQSSPDGDDRHETVYRIEVSREKATNWIAGRINRFQNPAAHECSAEDVLNFLIERTGLLREPAGGLIDFPHRSFQEYLAACAAGAERKEDTLAKLASDDQWHETIMLAAGTPTGGVGFGRALIEALLNRALRHKSSKASSRQVRKTCLALALGCLENLRQQDPELRTRVLEHLEELVPPKDPNDARILSVAGDAVVPRLNYSVCAPADLSTRAACARALSLIGTSAAVNQLYEGYKDDTSPQVAKEVCRSGSISYEKVSAVAANVGRSGELPGGFPIPKLSLLANLKGLKALHLNAPLPQELSAAQQLSDLTDLSFEGASLDEIKDVPWPDQLTSIGFSRCSGIDIGWISRFKSLNTLTIAECRDLTNLEVLRALPHLRHLTIIGSDIADMSPVRHLTSLNKLQLIDCKNLSDLGPVGRLKELKNLDIAFAGQLADIAGLESLTNLETLSIVGPHKSLTDFQPLTKLSGILEIELAGLSNLSELPNLGGSGKIKKLLIADCDTLETTESLTSCSSIEEVQIYNCRALGRLASPNLPLTLTSLSLGNLPRLRELDMIPARGALASLALTGLNLLSYRHISALNSLRILSIHGPSQDRDCSFVSQLQTLESLHLAGADDKSGKLDMSGLRNLTSLGLVSMNSYVDLRTLAGADNLTRIAVVRCPKVTNWASLTHLPKLQRVETDAFRDETSKAPDELAGKIITRSDYHNPSAFYRRSIQTIRIGAGHHSHVIFSSRHGIVMGRTATTSD